MLFTSYQNAQAIEARNSTSPYHEEFLALAVTLSHTCAFVNVFLALGIPKDNQSFNKI